MLNTASLIDAIKAAFNAESDVEVNPAEARQRTATAMANAIDAFVRSGTVTGTCATPSGPGTITGNVT